MLLGSHTVIFHHNYKKERNGAITTSLVQGFSNHQASCHNIWKGVVEISISCAFLFQVMSVESSQHSESLNSSTDSTASSSSSGLEVLSKVCAAAMAVEQNMDTTEPMDTSSSGGGSNNSSIRRSPSFKERIHPKFRKNSTPGTT